MDRLKLEELGYRFEVDQFQCKVRVRTVHALSGLFNRYEDVFFDSWPNPRPLPKVWGVVLGEAQRDLAIRRLSQ